MHTGEFRLGELLVREGLVSESELSDALRWQRDQQSHVPIGFRHRDLRPAIAQLWGRHPARYTAGQMTYDLRRLRLHGLIERVPRSHRYRITPLGARIAVLYVRIYARGFRPAASLPTCGTHPGSPTLERLDGALTKFLQEVRLVA
jgi:hypothetical protein